MEEKIELNYLQKQFISKKIKNSIEKHHMVQYMMITTIYLMFFGFIFIFILPSALSDNIPFISFLVKWKSKFRLDSFWTRIFDFEQLFQSYPIQKYPEKCYNPCYEVCLFAWQTDDWSSLRKNKFHPSNIKNEVGFGRLVVVPGGYLSASFMIIPAGKG